MIEINRPNRQTRRRRGKSDPIDAEAAAHTVLAGAAFGVAKADTAAVGMVRALRVARRSALKSRIQASNQLQAVLVCAPAPLREELRPLSLVQLVQRAAAFRPGPVTTATAASKLALRCLAIRHQALADEIDLLDRELRQLTTTAAPALCRLNGVGPDVAGALLVAAGDNPARLRSEASFASLCGASPIPASSGKTNRYRLNRGGDRMANNVALADRHGATGQRRANPTLHGPPDPGGALQAGDHPLPEALCGQGGVPRSARVTGRRGCGRLMPTSGHFTNHRSIHSVGLDYH